MSGSSRKEAANRKGGYTSLNLQPYKGARPDGGKPFAKGLQSLGKVAATSRRMPAPASLPSLRSENSGNDPSVNLVPSGGGGWKNSKDGKENRVENEPSLQEREERRPPLPPQLPSPRRRKFKSDFPSLEEQERMSKKEREELERRQREELERDGGERERSPERSSRPPGERGWREHHYGPPHGPHGPPNMGHYPPPRGPYPPPHHYPPYMMPHGMPQYGGPPMHGPGGRYPPPSHYRPPYPHPNYPHHEPYPSDPYMMPSKKEEVSRPPTVKADELKSMDVGEDEDDGWAGHHEEVDYTKEVVFEDSSDDESPSNKEKVEKKPRARVRSPKKAWRQDNEDKMELETDPENQRHEDREKERDRDQERTEGGRGDSSMPDGPRQMPPYPPPYHPYPYPPYDPYGYPMYPPPPGHHYHPQHGYPPHSQHPRYGPQRDRKRGPPDRDDFFSRGGNGDHRGAKRKWSAEEQRHPRILAKPDDKKDSQKTGEESGDIVKRMDTTSDDVVKPHVTFAEDARDKSQSPSDTQPTTPAMRGQHKRVIMRKMGAEKDGEVGPEQSHPGAKTPKERPKDLKTVPEPGSLDSKEVGSPDSKTPDSAGESKGRPMAWTMNDRGPISSPKTLYEPEGKRSEVKFLKYQHAAGEVSKQHKDAKDHPDRGAHSPSTPSGEVKVLPKEASDKDSQKAAEDTAKKRVLAASPTTGEREGGKGPPDRQADKRRDHDRARRQDSGDRRPFQERERQNSKDYRDNRPRYKRDDSGREREKGDHKKQDSDDLQPDQDSGRVREKVQHGKQPDTPQDSTSRERTAIDSREFTRQDGGRGKDRDRGDYRRQDRRRGSQDDSSRPRRGEHEPGGRQERFPLKADSARNDTTRPRRGEERAQPQKDTRQKEKPWQRARQGTVPTEHPDNSKDSATAEPALETQRSEAEKPAGPSQSPSPSPPDNVVQPPSESKPLLETIGEEQKMEQRRPREPRREGGRRNEPASDKGPRTSYHSQRGGLGRGGRHPSWERGEEFLPEKGQRSGNPSQRGGFGRGGRHSSWERGEDFLPEKGPRSGNPSQRGGFGGRERERHGDGRYPASEKERGEREKDRGRPYGKQMYRDGEGGERYERQERESGGRRPPLLSDPKPDYSERGDRGDGRREPKKPDYARNDRYGNRPPPPRGQPPSRGPDSRHLGRPTRRSRDEEATVQPQLKPPKEATVSKPLPAVGYSGLEDIDSGSDWEGEIEPVNDIRPKPEGEQQEAKKPKQADHPQSHPRQAEHPHGSQPHPQNERPTRTDGGTQPPRRQFRQDRREDQEYASRDFRRNSGRGRGDGGRRGERGTRGPEASSKPGAYGSHRRQPPPSRDSETRQSSDPMSESGKSSTQEYNAPVSREKTPQSEKTDLGTLQHKDFDKYDLNSHTIAIVDNIENVEGGRLSPSTQAEFVEVTSKKEKKEKLKKEKEEQRRLEEEEKKRQDDERVRKSRRLPQSKSGSSQSDPKLAHTWTDAESHWAGSWEPSHLPSSSAAPGSQLKGLESTWPPSPQHTGASSSIGVIGDNLQSKQLFALGDIMPMTMMDNTTYTLFGANLLSTPFLARPATVAPPATGVRARSMLDDAVAMTLAVGVTKEEPLPPDGVTESSQETAPLKEISEKEENEFQKVERKGGKGKNSLPPRFQAHTPLAKPPQQGVGRGRGFGRGGERRDRERAVGGGNRGEKVIPEQRLYAPPHQRGETSHQRGEPPHQRGEPPHQRGEPSHQRGETSHQRSEPSHQRGETSHQRSEPSHQRGETSHQRSEPSHQRGEPPHQRGEPSRQRGETSHQRGEPPHQRGETSRSQRDRGGEKRHYQNYKASSKSQPHSESGKPTKVANNEPSSDDVAGVSCDQSGDLTPPDENGQQFRRAGSNSSAIPTSATTKEATESNNRKTQLDLGAWRHPDSSNNVHSESIPQQNAGKNTNDKHGQGCLHVGQSGERMGEADGQPSIKENRPKGPPSKPEVANQTGAQLQKVRPVLASSATTKTFSYAQALKTSLPVIDVSQSSKASSPSQTPENCVISMRDANRSGGSSRCSTPHFARPISALEHSTRVSQVSDNASRSQSALSNAPSSLDSSTHVSGRASVEDIVPTSPHAAPPDIVAGETDTSSGVESAPAQSSADIGHAQHDGTVMQSSSGSGNLENKVAQEQNLTVSQESALTSLQTQVQSPKPVEGSPRELETIDASEREIYSEVPVSVNHHNVEVVTRVDVSASEMPKHPPGLTLNRAHPAPQTRAETLAVFPQAIPSLDKTTVPSLSHSGQTQQGVVPPQPSQVAQTLNVVSTMGLNPPRFAANTQDSSLTTSVPSVSSIQASNRPQHFSHPQPQLFIPQQHQRMMGQQLLMQQQALTHRNQRYQQHGLTQQQLHHQQQLAHQQLLRAQGQMLRQQEAAAHQEALKRHHDQVIMFRIQQALMQQKQAVETSQVTTPSQAQGKLVYYAAVDHPSPPSSTGPHHPLPHLMKQSSPNTSSSQESPPSQGVPVVPQSLPNVLGTVPNASSAFTPFSQSLVAQPTQVIQEQPVVAQSVDVRKAVPDDNVAEGNPTNPGEGEEDSNGSKAGLSIAATPFVPSNGSSESPVISNANQLPTSTMAEPAAMPVTLPPRHPPGFEGRMIVPPPLTANPALFHPVRAQSIPAMAPLVAPPPMVPVSLPQQKLQHYPSQRKTTLPHPLQQHLQPSEIPHSAVQVITPRNMDLPRIPRRSMPRDLPPGLPVRDSNPLMPSHPHLGDPANTMGAMLPTPDIHAGIFAAHLRHLNPYATRGHIATTPEIIYQHPSNSAQSLLVQPKPLLGNNPSKRGPLLPTPPGLPFAPPPAPNFPQIPVQLQHTPHGVQLPFPQDPQQRQNSLYTFNPPGQY